MSRRDEILAAVESIDALPPVAAQMIPLLQNPNVKVNEIADHLRHDPSLTASMLRLANCSLNAARTPIVDVSDAVKRLGTKRILGMVIGSSVASFVHKPVRGYDLGEGELWRSAVATAIGTEELAKVLGVKSPAHAFTSGLLADIGKIVLGTFLAVDANQITNRAFNLKVPFDEAERDVLGIDHAEVGAQLLNHWKIPQEIVQVVRWHHQPEKSTDQDSCVALVHVADHICALSGIGAGVDGLNYRPCEQILADLNVKPDTIEKTLCLTIERLGEVEESLLSPTGSL